MNSDSPFQFILSMLLSQNSCLSCDKISRWLSTTLKETPSLHLHTELKLEQKYIVTEERPKGKEKEMIMIWAIGLWRDKSKKRIELHLLTVSLMAIDCSVMDTERRKMGKGSFNPPFPYIQQGR